MAAVAGFTPIRVIAELVNIGTLAAFVIVCLGVILLRYTHPELPRPFRTPFGIFLPILGILTCLYLMYSLPGVTWLRFFVWLAIGLVIYFMYSRSHSSLESTPAA
jgi:APA family basic amino acid/polyamine antiporter